MMTPETCAWSDGLRFDYDRNGIWVRLPSVPHGPYFVPQIWINRARCQSKAGASHTDETIARNIAIGIRAGSYRVHGRELDGKHAEVLTR